MDSALTYATKYLEARQLSIARVADCLPDVAPWEGAIFGGSIPEGLANADSDIDLMVLGGMTGQNGQVVMEGEAQVTYQAAFAPLKIQLECVPLAHLEALSGRMRETAAALSDAEHVPRVYAFPLADLRILHRVRTGICLRNPDVVAHWQRRLHVDVLPKYLMVLMTVHHFSLREDAIGEAREGRRESSLWLMGQALSCAAGMLLASTGDSHPYDKWRVRLLQLHADDIESAVGKKLIEALITPPGNQDADTYLREAIDLSDEVVESALINCSDVLPVLMKIRDQQPPLTTHPAALA